MTIKTTGAEWKKYYSDPLAWPDGAYHDYEELFADGVFSDGQFDLSEVSDNSRIEFSKGVFYRDENSEGVSLEAHFRKWLRAQTRCILVVVEIDIAKLDEFVIAAKVLGGKIIK